MHWALGERAGSLGWLTVWEEHREEDGPEEGPLTAHIVTEHLQAPALG